MKEFDYAAAWHDLAREAYQALPQNVRDLVALTAEQTEGLAQLKDLTMPWPEGLRLRYAEIPAEILADAARAVYFVGHWFPAGGDLVVPGRQHGAHWKFSAYCDQELRRRAELPETGRDNERGIGFGIHQGRLRVSFASRDSWLWEEVAPGTVTALAALRRDLVPWLAAEINGRTRGDRDGQAYTAFQAIKAGTAPGLAAWRAHEIRDWNTDRFMVERTERKAPPADLARERAALIAQTERKINEQRTNERAMLWVLDQGLSIDNVIFYHHTETLCFGWRDKLSEKAIAALLDVVSECPFKYEIRGYVPQPA
jgi:hypothetical protein